MEKEKEKYIQIANDAVNRSNNDLIECRDFMFEEFNKTKKIILDLVNHLTAIEDLYNNVNDEIGKRIK